MQVIQKKHIFVVCLPLFEDFLSVKLLAANTVVIDTTERTSTGLNPEQNNHTEVVNEIEGNLILYFLAFLPNLTRF